jgi:1-acyl-sn-glycerol-3-phosphate acyltransferase
VGRRAHLRAAGCTPRLVETTRPGHARELLTALPRGARDAVVVAGGDGSLHEAVNGFMAAGTPRAATGAAGAGQGLVVFPEGTFHRAPGLRPFKLSGFLVAAQAGVPLLPVTIRGMRSILRDG